ncbi:MAG: hypothetical protein IKY86_00025 [Clostridia bacterium]|nr:hypothetical protein [Clostridia bacterium]
MKAGFARLPITPAKPMTLAGFDRRTAPAVGALEDLYVSVLVLEDEGGGRFLLCSFDLLGVDRALCKAVREALSPLLPPERIWLCATHTHSAPRGAFSGGISQDDGYISNIISTCKAAAFTAIERLSPASAFFGEGEVAGVASLRDVPREQAAFRMPLRVLKIEGEALSLPVVRFACHPTVLSEDNLQYSRDLPGGAETTPALWLNGPCADLSTRFTRRESSPREVQRMGALIKSAFASLELHPAPHFGAAIRVCEQELQLPYGGALRGEARQALLEQLLAQAATCTDDAARRELDSCIAVLERGDRELPDSRTVTVAACDLGSHLLLALPFEVSWQDGLKLEQEAAALCQKPALLVCYCGGYDGYLPHEQTGISYQDLATGFLPQAREMIWQNALKCAQNTQL